MKLKLPDNPLQFIYKLKLPERMAIGGVVMLLVGYIVYSLVIPVQLLNLRAVGKQLLVQKNYLQSKKEKAR